MTRRAFKTHIEGLIKDYKKVEIISLLQDKKERELKLNNSYYKQYYDCEAHN